SGALVIAKLLGGDVRHRPLDAAFRDELLQKARDWAAGLSHSQRTGTTQSGHGTETTTSW
ncbi:MAG: hypothetical protein NZ739_10455, partial [Verrucomicrobiae bacterium]|nr:hypothetical protein [Verrucomicrobiae bacterium]